MMRRVENPQTLVVDIWGFWEEMRYRSSNGYFSLRGSMKSTRKHRFAYKEAM